MNAKKRKKSFLSDGKKVFSLVLFASLIDLFFLYYLKYKNQNLRFSNFSLTNLGNILNLIFTLLIAAGLIVYYLQKNERKKRTNEILILAIIMTVFLLISAAVLKFNLNVPDSYVFGHPLKKVLSGSLLFVFQFVQFIFVFYVWLLVFGRNDFTLLRAVLKSVLLTFILFGFSFLYSQPLESSLDEEVKRKGIDIAVVLGAAVWSNNRPSPTLASRVDKAVELYKIGAVKKIQLTGSNAPGELSEAEAAFNYISKNEISPDDLLIEKKTTSTAEQVQFIKKTFQAGSGRNVVIISDRYHLKRVKEICKFYDLNVYLASSELNPSFENKTYNKARESLALLIFWLFAI